MSRFRIGRVKAIPHFILSPNNREACQANSDHRLSLEDLQNWELEFSRIPPGAGVFTLTGWGKYWEKYELYKNTDALRKLRFPGFSAEAARFLVEERAAKRIGIDALSVDDGLSADFSVHHIINSARGSNVENAAHLEDIPVRGGLVMIAPIKSQNGSGDPSRIWAVFEKQSRDLFGGNLE
jgi:kynurenine formamidase